MHGITLMTVLFMVDTYHSDTFGKTCRLKMFEKLKAAIEARDFSNIVMEFLDDGILISDAENPKECHMKSFFPGEYDYERSLIDYGNECFGYDEYMIDPGELDSDFDVIDGVRMKWVPTNDYYDSYAGCEVAQELWDCIDRFGKEKVLKRVNECFSFSAIEIREEIVDPTDRFRHFIALDFID